MFTKPFATPKQNRIRYKNVGDKVFRIVVMIFMTVFSLSFVFMFLWMFLNSFRRVSLYNANPLAMFNFEGVTWSNLFDNYKTAFSYTITFTQNRRHVSVGLPGMFGNSLTQIAISLASALVFPPAVGYVVAKYTFKLKRSIKLIVVMTMCIPTIGTTAATLTFLDALHLTNTWWAVVLLKSGGLGFGVLLYGNYFASVPWEYVESAKLDGAGNMTAYLRIMFPQARPLIVAQCILAIIGSWNDYMTSFMYLKYNPTVAYGIHKLASKFSNENPVVFSAIIFFIP